jgi:site-specific recombinase XerD
VTRVPELRLANDSASLDAIETPASQPQTTIPFRSFSLYPRQLRCLAEIAAAFSNQPFTRVELAGLRGSEYVKGSHDTLVQLVHRRFVSVTAARAPWSYCLTVAGVELAESLRQEHPLWQQPVRPETVMDARSEQLLVALDAILPGGRATVESATVSARKLFSKATYLAVKRRLILSGMLREDGWIEITPRGRSYLDFRGKRDPDDVWTLDGDRNPSQRAGLRVNFLPFPPRVRALAKEHIRQGMASHADQDYRLDQMPYLTEFIRTYLRRHPGADDLASLTIEDLDAFARTSCLGNTGESRAVGTVHTQLSAVRRFLAFVLEKDPTLLPATFQPRWTWGRVISRAGRPVLKSEPAAHLTLVETPEEAELRAQADFERDVWHIDALPGISRKDHWPQKIISFVRVPESYRPATKAYAKYLLVAMGKSAGTLIGNILYIARFLEYWTLRYPERISLAGLSVHDLSDYVTHIRASTSTPARIHDHYYGIWRFAVWLQRIEHPTAPTRPADRLFDPTIAPKPKRHSQAQQKWIPESVLRQLDTKIQHLDSMYVPIVVILRASGWRISDVVSLRYDTCLQQENDKWWLVGDIQKTRILGHRIPITEEVALAIRAQVELVKASLTPAENPHHYLFPTLTAQRRGRPIAASSVREALHEFAEKHQVLGDDRKPFRLKTHAFRHSKAVELINNGMPLDYVRQWLAHLSPEMTVVYAKIRDDVLRDRWEEATAEGVLRLDNEHVPELVCANSLADMNELELERIRGNLDATRTEKGYCFKPQKTQCTWAEIACYTCTHYATTPKFLPEFEQMEQDLLLQIELGRETGRAHWIEKNERKLGLIRPIVASLRTGTTVARLSKAQRETVAGRGVGKAADHEMPE